MFEWIPSQSAFMMLIYIVISRLSCGWQSDINEPGIVALVILKGEKVEYQVASVAGDIKKAVRVTIPFRPSHRPTSEKHTGTVKW
jgi:hypothetical protein